MTKAFFPYVNFATDEIKRRLDSENVKYFIAEHNGVTIGFVDFEITPEKKCKLMGLVVLEEHRRKGIARKLLEWIIAETRKMGCTAVFLLVAEDNAAAISLYRSFGFIVKGRADKVLNGKIIFIMEKSLGISSPLPSHLNSAG